MATPPRDLHDILILVADGQLLNTVVLNKTFTIKAIGNLIRLARAPGRRAARATRAPCWIAMDRAHRGLSSGDSGHVQSA